MKLHMNHYIDAICNYVFNDWTYYFKWYKIKVGMSVHYVRCLEKTSYKTGFERLQPKRLQRSKQRFFILVGNFAKFSFSGRIVTAYGLGDSAYPVYRGREPEDVKDLGR
jgi:hypothetical protein